MSYGPPFHIAILIQIIKFLIAYTPALILAYVIHRFLPAEPEERVGLIMILAGGLAVLVGIVVWPYAAWAIWAMGIGAGFMTIGFLRHKDTITGHEPRGRT